MKLEMYLTVNWRLRSLPSIAKNRILITTKVCVEVDLKAVT
jgi:hypothetical protein